MIDSTTPIVALTDVYNRMKQKTKNNVRYLTHFNILYNTLLEMFTWHNLPDTIPKRFLESILHSEGSVFVGKIKENLYAMTGSLAGPVDAYGMGTNVVAVCPVGEAKGKRNIDVAYGVNNDTATPDMLTYWIAHLMGEADKSFELNLIYSRLHPIPKVRDDKDKQAMDEIIEKLKDGEVKAFASKNILDFELGDNSAPVFELSDANKIDKIQYLSRFTDDIMKRFYNVYGQPLQTQNKAAQSISDELHGMDSVSFILPIQMLKCRQALAENINRIFGTDIEVEFSECWKIEYQALINHDANGNGIPDQMEPDSTEPEPGTGTDQEPEETPGNETEPKEPDATETEPPETDLNVEEPEETTDEPDATETEDSETQEGGD